MMQFSRSMGGTLGVSVMGVALSARLASNLNASGLDPTMVSQLLDPTPGSSAVLNEGARLAMADATHLVFVVAFIATLLALTAVMFTPRKELTDSPIPAPATTD